MHLQKVGKRILLLGLFQILFLFSFPLFSQPIPIVLPFNNPYYQKIASGFQKSFLYPTKIMYLKIQSEEEDDLLLAKELRELSPEIIVTIGDEASSRIRKNIKDIPILFSMVNSVSVLETEKENFCGYENSLQLIEYFRVLKLIKPEAKKIYALYSTQKSKQILERVGSEDIYSGLILIKKEISSKDNFVSILESLPKDADAFLMINDPIYDEKNFLYLSEYSIKNKISLFASYPSLVELGATLTLVPDYKHLGSLTADLANRVIAKNVSCSIGPVLKFQNYLLYLNEEFSKKSEVEIPESMKKRISSDKFLIAGIELLDKNMIKSARKVFEQLLRNDPNNELAKYYLNQIVNEQTKEEIGSLFLKGENLFANQQYEASRKVFTEILKINANHKEAKTRQNDCLRKESDILVLESQRLDKANQPFAAIKKLSQAISLYPSNQDAIQLLNLIKSRELKGLEKYLQEAISYYSVRQYNEAIVILENVLLVDSANKTASEYLRLSRIKLAAYKKLEDCARKSLPASDCQLIK